MIPPIILQEFAMDSAIVLARAFKDKQVACFGADGNGQYGSSPYAKHFTADAPSCRVYLDQDETMFTIAEVELLGYSATTDGHVATDVNLKISINKLLAAEYIDTKCWSWASLQDQGNTFFTIVFDTNKLLNG